MSDFVNIYSHYRCIVDNTKFWVWFWIYYDFAYICTWSADDYYWVCCPQLGRTGRRIGRDKLADELEDKVLQLGIVWLKLFPQSKQSNWHFPMDWPKDTPPTAINKQTYVLICLFLVLELELDWYEHHLSGFDRKRLLWMRLELVTFLASNPKEL